MHTRKSAIAFSCCRPNRINYDYFGHYTTSFQNIVSRLLTYPFRLKCKQLDPPETFKPTPVMYFALSETRNTIALAISSGLPGFLKAVRFFIRSFIFGSLMLNASVSMIPGTIALT